MKILIKNCNLISMDEERPKIENNIDILIDNDKIAKIEKDIKVEENIKLIDATGKIVMPGLINTHAHVPMSIFRETLDGYNLQDWLNKKIWPMEDKLTSEDIYYASYLSFIEMIENGCTTINDMYFVTEQIIKAMLETGVRLQTTRTLMDASGEQEGNKRIEELENLLQKYNNYNNKLTFNIGVHGLYTCSKEYVKKCIQLSQKYNLPIHMHFCENSKEVQDIKELYNNEPINILLELFNKSNILLAHAVKLEKTEIEKLKNINASVSHCPISNLKLGCGIANISEMLQNNINVSLGTDGQGSGSNLDLFEAMKFAALLQKGKNENAELMNAYELLKMATINGAKALNLAEQIGTITPWKQADLIILNLNNTKQKPINDIIAQIVYNCNGSNVETTIIDGTILMENRNLDLKIDKQDLYNKCEEIIKRIS